MSILAVQEAGTATPTPIASPVANAASVDPAEQARRLSAAIVDHRAQIKRLRAELQGRRAKLTALIGQRDRNIVHLRRRSGWMLGAIAHTYCITVERVRQILAATRTDVDDGEVT